MNTTLFKYKNVIYHNMADITPDIVQYIDKKEIDLNTFLNKFSEIVDDFIYNSDKLNF